ncbi:transposase family protein [Streptomyces sp. NPDC058985]|uniref:transposase family protein n=1 Tax=Streptomyces sp. NPDC058985 TaxID=3346684 RepID=UPI0036B06605
MSPRLEGLLLPSIADVSVLSLDVRHEAIRIDVCSTAAGAACPDCGSESTRVHSSYLRFPADAPSGGRQVVLRLRVRRFFCPESSCARRTFAEQLSGLARRHSRWMERLRSTLTAVGLALAGRAGARMAQAFGVSISRSAVLRLLEALTETDGAVTFEIGQGAENRGRRRSSAADRTRRTSPGRPPGSGSRPPVLKPPLVDAGVQQWPECGPSGRALHAGRVSRASR